MKKESNKDFFVELTPEQLHSFPKEDLFIKVEDLPRLARILRKDGEVELAERIETILRERGLENEI